MIPLAQFASDTLGRTVAHETLALPLWALWCLAPFTLLGLWVAFTDGFDSARRYW